MRALLALLLLCTSVPASAEASRPGEDACQADIHRLCDKFFPEETLVAACLVDRRAELSQACAELLANPPSAGAESAAPPAAGAPLAEAPGH